MDNYIPASIQTSEQLKHYKHTKAQHQYCERNLEKTREKARQRMQLVRSRAPRTAEAKAEAAEKCYARDANYRESMRKRKFIAKFGANTFFNYYVPQHKLRGADFLPGPAREYAQWRYVGDQRCFNVSNLVGLMISSPEWDQSCAQSKPLSDPNLVLCLIQMACPMPFFPNSTNYVGTGEHNKNPRKYWYLVLNQGVFTKKTDADTAAAGSAKVYIFFTCNDTRNKWAKNCIRCHAHDGDAVLDAEGDGASASSEDDSASSVRSISPTPGRQTPRRRCCAPHPFANGAQGHPSPQSASRRQAPSRTPVKKEFVLPLFRDDTPPLEMEVDPTPIVERTPIATPVKTRETPPMALSSSVSSVSSLSPTSSEGASASAPRAAPPALHFPRRAPAPTPANGASTPLPRAAAHACTPGGSASAAPHSQAQPAGSQLPFLYNETRRKLYKDVKKAMEEMANTDTVQVVDYQDTVQYLSAGRSSGSD
ncbi:hypothetical protein B0H14DRAFT_2585723 [Mycena olivaceomarginata]|nr:hypothetical protein B0H14DRAFT_2585723 [Mycena olivaceomarginata]